MGKMGWLHHLVQQAHIDSENDKDLKEHLSDLGFRNASMAAREFKKAYAELEEKAAKVGITGDNNGRSVNKDSR